MAKNEKLNTLQKELVEVYIEYDSFNDTTFCLGYFDGFTPDVFVDWATEIKQDYEDLDIVFRVEETVSGGETLIIKERRLETDAEFAERAQRRPTH